MTVKSDGLVSSKKVGDGVTHLMAALRQLICHLKKQKTNSYITYYLVSYVCLKYSKEKVIRRTPYHFTSFTFMARAIFHRVCVYILKYLG